MSATYDYFDNFVPKNIILGSPGTGKLYVDFK